MLFDIDINALNNRYIKRVCKVEYTTQIFTFLKKIK